MIYDYKIEHLLSWPRPVLYDHNVKDSYPGFTDCIGDINAYAGRVYALTRKQDIVVLPPSLREDFQTIYMHYKRIGLDTTRQILWHDNYTVSNDLIGKYDYNVFLYDNNAHIITKNDAFLGAVKALNNKNEFIRWCMERGFPVPTTYMYRRGDTPIKFNPGPWYVKETISAAGLGVFRTESWTDVIAACKKMRGDFQVQREVESDKFLNVQYFSDQNGKITHIATSEQILEGTAHIGNRYPVRASGRRVTDDAAVAAAQLGLRGVFAFDIAIKSADPEHITFIECNPRPNGATYPTIISKRLRSNKGWETAKIKIPESANLGEVDLRRFEYNSQSDKGLVLLSWGGQGIVYIMAIGSHSERAALVRNFSASISGSKDSIKRQAKLYERQVA